MLSEPVRLTDLTSQHQHGVNGPIHGQYIERVAGKVLVANYLILLERAKGIEPSTLSLGSSDEELK